jgi:muconate cycloisomerase
MEIVQKKAADIISIYTTKPGGIFKAKKVAAIAEAAGLKCNVNGSVETGVGNAANIHLAASTAVVTFDCVVPVSTPKDAGKQGIAGIYYRRYYQKFGLVMAIFWFRKPGLALSWTKIS